MEKIKKYFTLSSLQEQRLTALREIYDVWNSRINVISRKDMDNFYEHHVLHSLAIAKVIRFTPGTDVLDVGTGGGFPGIPLAIMFPESSFVLCDSIGKKIKVVDAVIEELQLTNAKTFLGRAENINRKFDFIVSRAVTELEEFYKWTGNNIKNSASNSLPNGILYLKGGDIKNELQKVKRKNKVYDLADYFSEEYFETKKLVHIF
jgi:16S rRNA (guanine527-N7)-methyltransferase